MHLSSRIPGLWKLYIGTEEGREDMPNNGKRQAVIDHKFRNTGEEMFRARSGRQTFTDVFDWFDLPHKGFRDPNNHIHIGILHSDSRKPWLVGSFCFCGLMGRWENHDGMLSCLTVAMWQAAMKHLEFLQGPFRAEVPKGCSSYDRQRRNGPPVFRNSHMSYSQQYG